MSINSLTGLMERCGRMVESFYDWNNEEYAMNAELKDRVTTIVRDTLTEDFGDEFTFEPVAVVEDIDEFTDDEQEYIENHHRIRWGPGAPGS